MNKSSLIPVIVILLIGIGAYYIFQKPSPDAMTEPTTMMVEKETVPEGGSMMEKTVVDSRYVEYSPEAYAAAADKRRVLFFYASWCPICRPVDAEFKAKTDQIPEDVTIIRVNYKDDDTDADEKAFAQKYGIVYQHTFVQIDADGKEVAKWSGGELADLLQNIK